jgi:hypothetical protein
MKRTLSIIAAAVISLVASSVPASAQVTPSSVIPLTLSASTVGSNTTATITSQAFPVSPGHGFAVVPNFQLSTTGTSNVTFNFQVSVDGVTWTTTTPFTCAIAATGATPVIAFYNFQSNVTGNGADNIAWVRLASVTNGNTGPTVTINSVTITKDY